MRVHRTIAARFVAYAAILAITPACDSSRAPGQQSIPLGTDTDGDGVLDSVDNCPYVINPDQANCNYAFEVANGQDVWGDVCDSVPCPTPTVGGDTLTRDPTFAACGGAPPTCANPSSLSPTCPVGCVLNADCASCACCGSYPNDIVVTHGHNPAEYASKPPAYFPNYLGLSAELLPDTYMRFCQNDLPSIDCESSISLTEAQLTVPEGPSTTAHPWHRVTVFAGPGDTPGDESVTPTSGTFDLDVKDIGGISVFKVKWLYETDLGAWLKDPSNPMVPRCTANGVGLPATCLDGVWWVSAQTTIGQIPFAGDLTHLPGMPAGLNISDGITPIRPITSGVSWCPIPSPIIPFDPPPGGSTGPIGWGPGKLVWLAPGPITVLDTGALEGDSRLLVADTGTQTVGALLTDGTAVAAQDIGQASCGGNQVDHGIVDGLLSTNTVWLGAIEPSRAIPGLAADAVAMTLDGTQVLTTAKSVDGHLISSTPGTVPGDPPAPRTGWVATYSRSAGGVFVAGGTSMADASILHDVWFQPIGGAWSEVTPHGGAHDLGTIRAMTYSFADRMMWFIDEIPLKGHLTASRLLRASPGGDIHVLATWLSLGLVDREFLSLDHDGAALVTFARHQRGFAMARVAIDPETNAPRVEALFSDVSDTLHGAPFVSPVAYGFFVNHVRTDEVLRLPALPALSTHRNLDEAMCP